MFSYLACSFFLSSFLFLFLFVFFFNDTATTEIYTLSLHDALPILEYDDKGIDYLISKWYQPTNRPFRMCQPRSEEHTSELQSHSDLVCRLLLEKKKKKKKKI